eukprot:387785_1
MTSIQSNLNSDVLIESVLNKAGFVNVSKISNTLQGGIWEGKKFTEKETIIIKVTNKFLHKHSLSIETCNKTYIIDENILQEMKILKYLTKQNDTPKSIIKYKDFFKSHYNYYLVLSHGGSSMFQFVVKAHKLISIGKIDISEWHKIIKVIFLQMIETIEYIHNKSVCHFDISLENWLIGDVQIQEMKNNMDSKHTKIKFLLNTLQISLCDFGLAHYFENCNSDKNNGFITDKYCGKINYQCPEINLKKNFDARSNDIFCLGVCLFMLTLGVSPWKQAVNSDNSFIYIINGHIKEILKGWNRIHYVDDSWIDLIRSIFRYENKRTCLTKMKNHPWLQ